MRIYIELMQGLCFMRHFILLLVLAQVISVGVGMRDVELILINSAGIQAGVGELAEIYMRR